MLSGNIHLSSDLRRLNFVKLYVWLSSPRSLFSREGLVRKYRKTVQDYREKYNWNLHPTEGYLPGTGIGADPGSKKKTGRSFGPDVIALNHLTLAQNLNFLRKGDYSWSKNGYVLACLSADEDGVPFFQKKEEMKKELEKQGFIAVMPKSEQLIFSSALLEVDIDRIIPILLILEQESTGGDIEDQFLHFSYKWLETKLTLEASTSAKYRLRLEQKSVREKIDRLENEKKRPKSTLKTGKPQPSMKTYLTEQVSPRLHFLQDLSFVKKIKRGYSLTENGLNLRIKLFDTLPEELDSKTPTTFPLEDEQSLLEAVVELATKELKPVEFEEFKIIFSKTARFYKRAGALLQNYSNTFKSSASIALENGRGLNLSLFDSYLANLSENRMVSISTSGRGTKYIRVSGNL
jgi:hypothetical protein